MRVLYIVGGNGKGYGSEKIAELVMSETKGLGVEFVVVTSRRGVINNYCDSHGIENYVIKQSFFVYVKESNCIYDCVKRTVRLMTATVYDYLGMKAIEKQIDLKTIDLIHTNLSRTLLGGRLAHKHRVPHIWHLQELYEGHYGLSPLKKKQVQWMNSHVNAYIAISNAVLNTWEKAGIDKKKARRIYNATDVNEIPVRDRRLGLKDHIKIVMAGQLCEEKGQKILMEAVGSDPRLIDTIEIDFYGEGKEEDVRKLVEVKNHFGLAISFKGYSKDLKSRLCEYDVGLTCSKGEGFGLATLEYMAAGLCVIVSNTGANEELINSENVGYVFDREKPNQLASILLHIIDNPSIIEEKGRNARGRAETMFCTDQFGKLIYEEYKRNCSTNERLQY